MINDSLLHLDEQVIADALKIRFYPMAVQAAKGTWVIDKKGKSYLDLTAGWAVASTGYGHPRIAQRIKEQYETISFMSQLSIPEKNMIHHAEKLIQITPDSFSKKGWFGHSGSDANDCIAKLVPLSRSLSDETGICPFRREFV
ncbi:aminotransferase class III-fold pyridoxal phosphate-dependent enzyme [Aneurinibacillus terranovensis]|uniref:aminotransferase class III-fold pyridoxal phosphate-dependent enzyme n=1 Tax=Aneurinibacillus terranovensis TaxID=278991 RepID=UPI000411E6DF|nr:aminotransferase class III-fold pyridoxal phosphate-dependent enzyme [Aneurinibacillus terranovensis]